MLVPSIVHVSEPHDIYVGRPSKYGNPYSHKDGTLAEHHVATRVEAVDCFEQWIYQQPELLQDVKNTLKDKTLACWCRKSEPCHARVLFKIANGYWPDIPITNIERSLF